MKTDIWDVEDGVPVCWMPGPDVCGKAELGSGRPELLSPQMEMKGRRLAQPKQAKLRFPITRYTKRRRHNNLATSKWSATSVYCGNRTGADSLARACMFCPKPWPATYFTTSLPGTSGAGEPIPPERLHFYHKHYNGGTKCVVQICTLNLLPSNSQTQQPTTWLSNSAHGP